MIPVKDTSSKGFAVVTILIIIANIAMFFEETRTGRALFDLYGVSPHDIYLNLIKWQGQPSQIKSIDIRLWLYAWRIFTSYEQHAFSVCIWAVR